MPARFKYQAPNQQFQCALECSQCIATSTATGRQCSRSTCISTPYCWQHTRSVLKLRVMKSMFLDAIGINALGLYAWDKTKSDRKEPVHSKNKVIKPDVKGETLYQGEVISKDEFDDRYDFVACGDQQYSPTGPYALHKSSGNVRDAACVRGIGLYANALQGFQTRGDNRIRRFMTDRKNQIYYTRNAKLLKSGNLKATKHLYHGDEILIAYGPDFWKGVEFDCDGVDISPRHVTYPLKVSGDRSLGIPAFEADNL